VASIPLKPEYGPTLGELLAPRWHAASPRLRALALAAGLGLLALVLSAALTLENAHYSHGGAAPFSFSYRGLYRTAPGAGEYVRVQRPSHGRPLDSFAVGPLRLPPYTSSLSAELPLYAATYIAGLRHRYSRFVLRAEGKTRVNTVPAYTIAYTAQLAGGQTVYGRDILLLPERPGARQGVRIVMLSLPTPRVSTPLLVGTTGVLERPLETFTLD
jgi:hypothetical protein